MPKDSPHAGDPAAAPTPPAEASASPATPETASAEAAAAAPQAAYAPVAAPPQRGLAPTVDNRVGFRKEVSDDGKLQIRFAQRPDGSRPDDELLEPVRGKQPHVKWSDREKAWQAQTAEGADALDDADTKLAEIGRQRTRGHER
jgi:hypothetical protein